MDFVIPWVDDSDVEWAAEKAKYAGAVSQKDEVDLRECRYRDWDTLRYWFRGVEQFAPWVRKIHFITCGHIPQWLNVHHPKLNHVKHSDYIPHEYLPVFSANPIEVNIHRIADLSDQFVYFNDDMFIIRPVKQIDFFVHGKPCAAASLSRKTWDDLDEVFTYILFNDRSVTFRNFKNKKNIIFKNLNKWLSFTYGTALLLKNLKRIIKSEFLDLDIPHGPASFLKSTFFEVWEKEEKILMKTSAHKFRSPLDVNQYLFQEWQIMSGNFAPYDFEKTFCYFAPGNVPPPPYDISALREAIVYQKYNTICVNDTEKAESFPTAKKAVMEAFNKILPERSAFECF
jgi:hypothetical protein